MILLTQVIDWNYVWIARLDEAFFYEEKKRKFTILCGRYSSSKTSYELTRVLENKQQGQQAKPRLLVQQHLHQPSQAQRCQKTRTETMQLWQVWWLFSVRLVGTWKQVERSSQRSKSKGDDWLMDTSEWIKQGVSGITHSSLVRNFDVTATLFSFGFGYPILKQFFFSVCWHLVSES